MDRGKRCKTTVRYLSSILEFLIYNSLRINQEILTTNLHIMDCHCMSVHVISQRVMSNVHTTQCHSPVTPNLAHHTRCLNPKYLLKFLTLKNSTVTILHNTDPKYKCSKVSVFKNIKGSVCLLCTIKAIGLRSIYHSVLTSLYSYRKKPQHNTELGNSL